MTMNITTTTTVIIKNTPMTEGSEGSEYRMFRETQKETSAFFHCTFPACMVS
jgi:hypothetical protein